MKRWPQLTDVRLVIFDPIHITSIRQLKAPRQLSLIQDPRHRIQPQLTQPRQSLSSSTTIFSRKLCNNNRTNIQRR